MTFLVIPALDLKNRRCVQLEQGNEERIIVELNNPVEVAEKWQGSGAERLHLVDLDGAIHKSNKNLDIVEKVVKNLDIPVQFGGGIRSKEDAEYFLDLGIDKIIIGTMAIKEPKSVKDLSSRYGKERITIALDSKGGNVVIKGWKEETGLRAMDITKKYENYASEVLFTNVDVEGLMKGINENMIKELVSSTSLGVIVAGGISSMEDIEKIKDSGALGVVIGSAIYTGKLDFKEALEVR